MSARGPRPPVLFVAAGRADLVRLNAMAQRYTGATVLSELPLGGMIEGESFWLPELHAVASREDRALRIAANEAAGQVLRKMGPGLRRQQREILGVDLLEVASFEYDDMVYQKLRRATNLVDFVRGHDVGSIVLLGSRSSMLAATRTALRSLVGTRNVVYIENDRGLQSNIRRVRQRLSRPVEDAAFDFAWWLRHALLRAGTGSSGRRASGRHEVTRALMVVSPTTAHIRNVAAVIEELPDFKVTIAPTTLAGASRYEPLAELERQRPNVQLDWSLARAGSLGGAARFRRSVRRQWEGVEKLLESIESEQPATDVNSADVWPLLAEAVVGLLRTRLPRLAATVGATNELLRQNRPNIVVVAPDRSGTARSVISLCRQVSIPTIFTQALYFTDGPQYRPLQADYATLIDTFSRNIMVNRFGVTPNRLAITGAATIDVGLGITDKTRPATPPVALLALQPDAPTSNERLILAVCAAISRGPAPARLVVRPHPRESTNTQSRYRELLVRHGGGVGEVRRDEELSEAILRSQVVVSGFSNVLLEAAVLQRTALSVNLWGEPLPVPFGDMGVAVEVTSLEGLDAVLLQLLHDRAARDEARARQERYMSENPHFRLGPSAPRIAEELRTRIRTHGTGRSLEADNRKAR